MRERIPSREPRSTEPFPWARSHDDARQTAIFVGLNALVFGLVLTLFVAPTPEGPLGFRRAREVDHRSASHTSLDAYALDRTEAIDAPSGQAAPRAAPPAFARPLGQERANTSDPVPERASRPSTSASPEPFPPPGSSASESSPAAEASPSPGASTSPEASADQTAEEKPPKDEKPPKEEKPPKPPK